MPAFDESVVEQAALAWLESVGWQVRNGAELAPGEPAAERDDYGQVVLAQRLRDALWRLNPALPAEALEDAFRKLTRPKGADLIVRNRALHRLLVDGVTVEYRDADGSIRGAQVRVIDFEHPDNNDWLAVNQFSVVENKHARRLDVVLFVNGLLLAVLELKNAAAENATIWSAFQQLQTYQAELPALFAPNALLAVSDGMEARVGTLGAGREWFKPWRTISRIVKKMAGYHQFHAVQVAVGETLRAADLDRARDAADGRYESGRKPGGHPGDRRVGVVWHTQGSGKSLTMVFYAGRIIREPAMENPTLVVLTRPAAPAAGAGREPRASARAAQRGGGRGGVHHHP